MEAKLLLTHESLNTAVVSKKRMDQILGVL